MTKLESLISALYGHVSRFFNEHGAIQPVWMLEDGDGKQTVVLSPFDGEASKDAVIQMMGELLTKHHAVRYAFATEIWRDRAHTKDAVLILAEERDGTHRGMMYEIDRSGDKPRLAAGQNADAVGGRFLGLFG